MNIRLLFTSDVHGFIFPRDYKDKEEKNLGLCKLSSLIKEKRDKNTILIDLGDYIQGSLLADYVCEENNRKYFAQIQNHCGYDISVLGNHDFNYGKDYLKDHIRNCNHTFLSANIKEDGKDFLKEYEIIEKEGIKVGIIGLTTPYIKNWELDENIKNLSFEPAFLKAKELVGKIRDRVDLVVLAYHGGFENDLKTGELLDKNIGENEGYKILKNIEGIDVILTGHQHREIAGNVDGVTLVQAGYGGKYLGCVDIEVDKDKKIIEKTPKLFDLKFVDQDKKIVEKFSYMEDRMSSWLNEDLVKADDLKILDTDKARFDGHPYLNLVNKIQLHYSGADISSTSLFLMDSPGLSGRVKRRDVLRNYPYNNTLAVISINGRELREALIENSMYFLNKGGQVVVNDEYIYPKNKCYNYDFYYGIDYVIDLNKSKEDRLLSLKYKGKDVKDDDKFSLATNQYRALGGGGFWMFKAKKIKKSIKTPINRLIISYLKELKYLKRDDKRYFKYV